jgi:RimJ/RimL family protein N-acetyltransferase
LEVLYMPSNEVPDPAYRIRTRRLIVRCWDPSDAALLKAAIDASLEHLRPWMAWAEDEAESLQAKIQRLRRFRGSFDLDEDFTYGVFSRDEKQVLGASGLHTRAGERAREIGYWIHAEHINQGLAAEVAAVLTRVAFEVDKVARVEIHCDPRNVWSAAVPRKLGFVHEATLRQRTTCSDGERRDSMIWTLLAEEYETSRLKRAEIEAYDVIGRRIL